MVTMGAAKDTLPAAIRELYPFKPSKFESAGGAVMSYLDEGQGDHAVLMLHGNPTWSFYYRNLVKELAGMRRCVVPDHIGMGLSEKPADYRYDLAQRIQDVIALVNHLGLKKIDLVVHDWGGAIGFGVANQLPDLINRIVIMNTAAFPSRHLPKRIAVCRWPFVGPLLVRAGNGFAGPAVWMAMSRRPMAAAESQGYLYPYNSWAHRVAVSAFVQDIPMSERHPSWATLAAIGEGLEQFKDRSTLIVWGGRDFCFNDHFFNEWQSRLPQAETLYLDDAGHYVLEDAANDVLPRIKQHLLAAKPPAEQVLT
jgi:cis-3-alkyl-4-acyloxetan-2-one decarboxylase